jgi:hypothetical protein
MTSKYEYLSFLRLTVHCYLTLNVKVPTYLEQNFQTPKTVASTAKLEEHLALGVGNRDIYTATPWQQKVHGLHTCSHAEL